MDSLSENEFNTHIDIETGLGVGSEEEGEDAAEEGEEQRTVYSKTCCRSSLLRIDGSTEITMSSSNNVVVLDDVKLFETRTKVVKEKKKSSKKPPRPPRSSKPLSLDAADQKLIKEISQLIILKRARVERIKALKVKSAKASSSNGNLFAMICTILFCVLFIFQGVSSGRRIDTTTTGFQVSTEIAGHGHDLLPIPPLNYDSMKPKVEEDADAIS